MIIVSQIFALYKSKLLEDLIFICNSLVRLQHVSAKRHTLYKILSLSGLRFTSKLRAYLKTFKDFKY